MPQLIYFIVMMVLSAALAPKPPKPKAAALADFDFPTADEGTPQIVVFGDVWLTDWTVIGIGNYRNQAIRKSTGGLFPKKVTTGYKYLMSLLMGACRGIDDLVEIKISDKTAWTGSLGAGNKVTININQPNLFGGDESEGGIVGRLIIQKGAADQEVLPELTAMYSTPVPAYRGIVTMFYDGIVCSNSPYPKPWSFRVRRVTSNWDGAVWYAAKAIISIVQDGKTIQAMNPAHIIYEAQTNRLWGRGFSAAQLDVASFQAAADQLHSEGFGLCLAWRRQDSLNEFIQEIVNTIGAAMYLDRLTGLWKLVLIRDNYNVATLPTYNASTGLLSILDDNNAANDMSSNQTTVSFRDPISNQDRQIRAENIASIQKYGVISENKSYAGIPTASLAGRIAARDMKISQSSLKKFKLDFDRRAYQMQPISVFKIGAPEQGIFELVLRAVRVEHNDITDGKITVTAMQDVFGLADQNFISSQPSLHQPPNLAAQQVVAPLIFEMPFAELLREFSVADLQAKTGQGYLSIAAQSPTSLHMSFALLGKTLAEMVYADFGQFDFAFIAEIASVIAQTATAVSCTLVQPIGANIRIGDRAILGDEIVRIDSIDLVTNTLMIARGCIDTVPKAHAANTKLYVYSNVTNTADRAFNVGETVNLKCITRTAGAVLDEASATVFNASLSNRLTRPYPPANVLLNDLSYPATLSALTKVSWRYRNRVTQGTTIVDQQAAASALEAGVTYYIKLYKKTSSGGAFTQVAEKSGMADSTIYINPAPEQTGTTLTADFTDAIAIRVELYAVLNSLESLQKHVIDVDIVV